MSPALAGRFFFFFVHVFIFYIFGCTGSLLLRAGFSLVAANGGCSSLQCASFLLGGFSCCRAWALGTWASVVVVRRLSSCGSQALERRLSSCGPQVYLPHGMWDLPRPGLEPVSPALAGGFLTTAPPGKSLYSTFIYFERNSGDLPGGPVAKTPYSQCRRPRFDPWSGN